MHLSIMISRLIKIMVESQNAESNIQNNKQGSQQLVGSGSGWCWCLGGGRKEKLVRSVKPSLL